MNYTKEQINAIESTDKEILLLAGAGAGKTSTSIGRLRYLIESCGVPADRILCLTFTRSAAEEFRFRCSDLPEMPFIGTFHEFCYRLLYTNNTILSKLGYSQVPRILEDFEEAEYKTELKMKLGLKIADKKLNDKKLCSPKEQFAYESFNVGLNAAYHKDSVISFDFLCRDVCKLFIEHDLSVQSYQFQYKYIFVDEFQNTDDIQWNFVKSFDRADKFLVGDMMQSIYLFRNATPQITQDIAQDKEWSKHRITENFRSYQEILDYANKITPSEQYADYKVNLVAHRGAGGFVELIPCEYGWENELLDMVRNIPKDRSVAILTRTNHSVQKIQNLLVENDISFDTNNNNKITDFEQLIKSVQSNEYLLSYLKSKLTGKIYYSILVMEYLGDLEGLSDTQKIKYLYDNCGTEMQIIVNKVNRIRCIIGNDVLTPQDKYTEICSALGIEPLADMELEPDETNAYIYDLVISTYKQNYIKESNLYVGTIHSAQGLEYDHVILTNVGSKEFKIDKDENKFLYYVGVTRAKDRLTIYTVGDNV